MKTRNLWISFIVPALLLTACSLWSIVYNMTSGDLEIVMGQDYSGTIHTFQLEQSVR